jgi:predicted ATPase
MLHLLEARHFKCLRQVAVPLEPFNVLIGPNASGKSTFLDLLGFVRDALQSDVEEAVRKRATSLRELVWRGENADQGFDIAIESDIPADLRLNNGYDRLRYELEVGLDAQGSLAVRAENLWMVNPAQQRAPEAAARTLFPMDDYHERDRIVRPKHSKTPPGRRLIVRKVADSRNDYFRSERTDWNISFSLSSRRLALSGIPEDRDRFPMGLWFKQFLGQHVHTLQLNSVLMRRPCPSDAPRGFQPDGSNLPVLVAELEKQQPQRFQWWLQHLQTILEDLEAVSVAERPEDRSLYLKATYRNGVQTPAWLLSDGTLRLLALTLIAYLPHPDQVFVVEEPENGIHPRALEGVFQSLTSVYEGQVFLATHSPLLLALTQPKHLLVFAKTPNGATDVVRGPYHPRLQEWQAETPLDTLFASGVLG